VQAALEGKAAIVTGAGGGIGRTIAERLAGDGAKVAVNYPPGFEGAEDVVAAIESAGGTAIALEADVADAAQREALFERTLAAFGRLDVLVNNAALDPGPTELFEVDEALYDRVLDVNLKGAFFCSQLAARILIRQGQGGRIINISSLHARLNFPNYAPYSLSKGGIDAMTRQLAMDLARHHITVNAVAPGFIEVARTRSYFERYDRDRIGRGIPAGRVGFPRDVAAVVAFLATDEAEFITGEVIRCDGGSGVRLSFEE